MPFKSLDELLRGLHGPLARRRGGRQGRPRPPGHADQAAGQPRTAGGDRRLAGALAGPRHAEAGQGAGGGVRRIARRDRAGRVGLPGRGDAPDGGEFRRRRRGDQPACPRRGSKALGGAAGGRKADRRLHARGGDERGGFSRRPYRRAMPRSTRTPTSPASARWASATRRRRRRWRPRCSAASPRNGSDAAPASTTPG